MKEDIFTNDLFKKMETREYCSPCQHERNFNRNGFYNLSMGCFSANTNIPIDILIITESIARGDLVMKQKDFNESQKINRNHYLNDPLYSYFQKSIRELLASLNSLGKSWYLTDLVKCYVEKEKEKFIIATKYCAFYLKETIKVLKPHTIISIGGYVSRRFFNYDKKIKLIHGEYLELANCGIELESCNIIHTIFPSSRTTDKFIEAGEWSKIIEKIN